MKTCSHCGEAKPLDAFYRRGEPRRTLHSQCKDCCAAAGREHYARNRDAYSERGARWRRQNPERAREFTRKWRAKNRAALAVYERAYGATHRVAKAAARRRRRAADPEKARAYQRRIYATSAAARACVKEANARRRAQLANVEVGPIDREAVMRRDRMTCCICGRRVAKKDVSLDHLVPIAKGGPHVEWNVAVAHRSCNSRKGARFALSAQPPLF